MANVLILGAGSMGSAFVIPCSDKKNFVSVIGSHLEDDFIDLINSKKKHPNLNYNLPDRVNFYKFDKLQEQINKGVDLIVVAVTSKGIEWAAKELSKVLKKKIPILLLTKGLALHNNNYEVLVHKMERLLKDYGIKETNISGAGGPCLAKGLSSRIHTSVVFANSDINEADKIANLVSNDYYHVFTSTDVVGVQICAAIKNIYSMIVGASEGLCGLKINDERIEENYLNTAASLIQQSINEMIIFTERNKGKKDTVMGLAGIGDLYVSADGGRNSKMGKHLGQGINFEKAKKEKMPNDTVEGADLVYEIAHQVKKDFDIKSLPLMFSLINTICDKKPLKVEWKHFK
tara:strand:+ start:783 stop:1820 length:1038 start_codon:yes stop_codon:yes gene_type:complete